MSEVLFIAKMKIFEPYEICNLEEKSQFISAHVAWEVLGDGGAWTEPGCAEGKEREAETRNQAGGSGQDS